MKNYFFILLLLTIMPTLNVSGQAHATTTDFFAKYGSKDFTEKSNVFIVQLQEKCSLPEGFQLLRALDEGVLIVRLKDASAEETPENCATRLMPANNLWKFSPLLEAEINQAGFDARKTYSYTIVCTDLHQLLNSTVFTSNQCRVVYTSTEISSVVITCIPAILQEIIKDQNILFADRYHVPQTEVLLNGFDKSRNSMNLAGYSFSMAEGSGITAGIKERKMDVTDMDLQGRIIPSSIAAAETEPHATTIATMIGGAGNSFYTGRGIARKCNFFSSSFFNLFPDSTNLLIQNRVNIQNHSYGTINQQFYGAEALAYDAQTGSNKNLLHVFSSGNRGAEAATTGTYSNLATFANLTGNYKNAKNVITTGALDTSGQIAPFSSSGPLYDGRLAPQIAAFGLNGTSDAAALVSGTAVLLHQVYKDSNAQAVPPASLVKAVLFNTTDDVASKGIDYRSGFGALNVFQAVASMLQKKYDGGQVSAGQVWTKNISIPVQSANMRITLCWTDTAGTVNNNKALINDLDLELVETGTGMVYHPWVLSTAPNTDSLKKLPVRKKDALNTAEQVSIDMPNAGIWQVRVIGTIVPTTYPQPFNISWGWDTLQTFVFTNPLQSEDISLEESPVLAIKWKTALTDAGATGNLFISYNNGTAWQPVAGGIPLREQQYHWPVKDTSSTAKLRMDCSFGSFFSNDFIIAPVTKTRLDFLCPDSAGITWQKHAYASAYRVYALPDDTAYMRPVLTTADTSIIFLRNVYPFNVFAVEPLLNNGLRAVRSAALDIRSQGINCFYTSLQALLNGGKIDLLLELSSTVTVDSVIFEKLGVGNSLLMIAGKLPVIAGKLSYVAVDNTPESGINIYRVRIKYKNGKSSYTEIVSVLTTGNKYLLLYPNPVSSRSQVNFQLRDIAADWLFQLVDIQGRIVLSQTITIAGKLWTGRLQAGLYFYRLTDKNTGIKEKGKLIITN